MKKSSASLSGRRLRALALGITLAALPLAAVHSQGVPRPRPRALTGFNVLTRNYNNQRTGANLQETVLTTANVNTSEFGKLFQLAVDEQVYAGILYVSNLQIAGGTHNVIYVATVNNSVFAFDADAAGAPLWQRNFNNGGRPTTHTEVGSTCGSYNDFSGNIGIVGTPVIDGNAGTIYFVTRVVNGSTTTQTLRALDITSGADRNPGSVVVSNAAFNVVTNNQRPALALSGGTVYVGWSSFCDTPPYHGLLIGFDATTLAQTGTFNVTAGSGAMKGGIWMAGAAPSFDASGNIYLPTGNGDSNGTTNFGQSVVRLTPKTLGVQDFFTPSNFSSLNVADLDLGSSGVVFLPGTNRIMVGGKEGKGYILNPSNLGHMVSGDTQVPQIFQAVDLAPRPSATHHVHNTMVTWNSPQGLNVYAWGENDFLHAFRFDTGSQTLDMPAFAVGSVLPPLGMPGGMMTISANGSQAGTGILWATTPKSGNANQMVVPGILYAFDAEDLTLLWSSAAAADDTLNFSKGAGGPLVARGKVYVASFSNSVSVYGERTGNTSPNLALNRPATGSAPCNANETPDKAFNGSVSGGNSDKFCSLAATKFLQVDLGSPMSLGRFIVRHAGAGGESANLDTRDFNIQVSSDGTNFTPVVTVTGNTSDVTTNDITPATGRFVRLNITTPTQTTDTAARIYELEVYGAGGSTPPPITFEAESLTVSDFTAGRTERVAVDAGYSGGQGVILEGQGAGDFVTFTVHVLEARTYDVQVGIKELNNRGMWQLDIGGANQGSVVDGFSVPAVFTTVDLGNVSFGSAGDKSFRFTVTGKNASATSFWLALDFVRLTPR
jgi:hypothetical protein